MPDKSTHKRLGFMDRLRRAPAVPLIALLGATSLSACGDEAAAEKPPVTATETPGATAAPTSAPTETAPETSSPDAPETSEPVKNEVIDGIDTSNLIPEAKARAEKLTPEFISTLETPEQWEDAFSITLDDIQLDNGKSAVENYAELSFVDIAAMMRAGCTPEDRAVNYGMDGLGYPDYSTYIQGEVLMPALTASFGEEGANYSPLKDYTFSQRCDMITFWLDNMRDLAKGDPLDAAYGELKDNPDAASMPKYSIAFTYDPSSLNVITDGTGQFGDALSVQYNIGFKETIPYTEKQLEIIGQYAGQNPASFGLLEGNMMIRLEGVGDTGDGNKLTTNTAYAEATSNQNPEDPTIIE